MDRYTAKDMREMALVEESYGWDVVAKMLRQAADLQEREEREKRYEYSVRDRCGFVSNVHKSSRLEALDCVVSNDELIIRREVGEWEEVPNV